MVRWEGYWIQPCTLEATTPKGGFLVLLESVGSLGHTPPAQLMGWKMDPPLETL